MCIDSVGEMVGFAPGVAAEFVSTDLARPKSRILTTPLGRELDVRRLQVAMDDALLVRRFETRGDLARDGERLIERQRTFEVGAFDQFHHQRALLDAVDGGDVGMIQRREHLRFTLEARHVLRVVGQRRGQHFDGDVAVQLGIAGAVHLAHAARADWCKNLIRAEFVAGGKWHFRESVQFTR